MDESLEKNKTITAENKSLKNNLERLEEQNRKLQDDVNYATLKYQEIEERNTKLNEDLNNSSAKYQELLQVYKLNKEKLHHFSK